MSFISPRAPGGPLVGRKALQEQESQISKAEYLCNQVLEHMHKDVLAFDHEDSEEASDGVAHKTTVGIMEKDLVVVNLLPGTPAESYLQKGDCITKVDGQEVNKHNVIDMLIGDDKPGTFVKVGYTRNDGPEQTCLVLRMSVAKLGDRRRLFELFTALRDKSQLATKTGGLWGEITSVMKVDEPKDSAALVDEAVELWSKMIHHQVDHDNQVVKTIDDYHEAGLSMVEDLKDTLVKLHSLYNRDLQRAADMEKKRVDQIASLEVENHALEDDNNVLIQENQSLRDENERLRRESQELQRRLSGCDDHMRELEDLRKRMAELQALREENKRLGRENQELQRRLSGCDDCQRELEDLRKRMAELQARLRAQPTQPSAPSPPPQGGRLAGIGLMLEREGHNPRVIISGVTAGGPAAKSGLIQAGDLLISVNGVLTEHISLDEIRHHIGGPVNTQIAVQIQGRDGVIKSLELTRGFILQQ